MKKTQGKQEETEPKVSLFTPEDLKGLPESVRLAVTQASTFSGPLPPPALYKEYEEVLPGSADRILSMAEKSADRILSMAEKSADRILSMAEKEQSQRHMYDTRSLENNAKENNAKESNAGESNAGESNAEESNAEESNAEESNAEESNAEKTSNMETIGCLIILCVIGAVVYALFFA